MSNGNSEDFKAPSQPLVDAASIGKTRINYRKHSHAIVKTGPLPPPTYHCWRHQVVYKFDELQLPDSYIDPADSRKKLPVIIQNYDDSGDPLGDPVTELFADGERKPRPAGTHHAVKLPDDAPLVEVEFSALCGKAP